MDISTEEENFAKVAKIVLEIIPECLRKLFIEKWNLKHPSRNWQSDSESGNYILNELTHWAKSGRLKGYANSLKSGNEKNWNTSTLVFSLLYADLSLIPCCRPENQRSIPLLISEEIDILMQVRNEFFAHASSMKCSSVTFIDIISKIKSVARNIFDIDAENQVDNIVQAKMTENMASKLKDQLIIEKNHNEKFDKALKGNVLCNKIQCLLFPLTGVMAKW